MNLTIWAIFYFLGLFADTGCIFPMACTNVINAYAIRLFCPSLGGLFLPFSSFIFEGLGSGWLED